MQRRNSFVAVVGAFVVSACLSIQVIAAVEAPSLSFRSPSRILGGRFTVKVELRQGKTRYVVPFWVDPDAAESSIDEAAMKDAGWDFRAPGKSQIWDEIKISGFPLLLPGAKLKLKIGSAAEAFYPDFVKSCCHGKIGRDVLQYFQVVAFDDRFPFLEWFRVDPAQSSFQVRPRIFSWETRSKKLFPYEILPPNRKAYLTEAWEGIPRKAEWTRIQGKEPRFVDRYLLDEYLQGRVDQNIEMSFLVNKKEIKRTIKFPSRSVPSP